MHSFGLGADHDGGYAEFGRFPADWVIPLPRGLTLFEASALGVAGHTAALAIDLMELNGLAPAKGKVLVNGATGGVASIAIDILARRGYHVVAMSGKADQADYLKIAGRAGSHRQERHQGFRPAAGNAAVGGRGGFGGRRADVLAHAQHAEERRDRVVRQRGRRRVRGQRAALHPARRAAARRECEQSARDHAARLWGRLASDLKPRHLERIARRIRFEDLEAAFDDLLAARVTGRQVVDFSLA